MYMELFYIIVGAVAGLHAACYGAYKDSPYEKFLLVRFIREILVGIFTAVVFVHMLHFTQIPIFVFYLIVLAWCRVITESYKQFIRVESQKQYKIPSMVHVFRKVPTSRILRILLGLGLFIVLYLAYRLAQIVGSTFNIHTAGALIGLIMGLLTAFGGGYKDGFFEGFERVKFFRSPIISLFSGLFLSYFVTNPFFILFGSLGMERMITECYKGFFKAKYVPGKFKFTKAAYPQYFNMRRKYILPVYVSTWVFFFGLLLIK